jgi:hypothetical protein
MNRLTEETQTRMVNYCIDGNEYAKLKERSIKDGIPITIYIRLAIGRFLQQEKTNPLTVGEIKQEPSNVENISHRIHPKRLAELDEIALELGIPRSRLMNHIISNFQTTL